MATQFIPPIIVNSFARNEEGIQDLKATDKSTLLLANNRRYNTLKPQRENLKSYGPEILDS